MLADQAPAASQLVCDQQAGRLAGSGARAFHPTRQCFTEPVILLFLPQQIAQRRSRLLQQDAQKRLHFLVIEAWIQASNACTHQLLAGIAPCAPAAEQVANAAIGQAPNGVLRRANVTGTQQFKQGLTPLRQPALQRQAHLSQRLVAMPTEASSVRDWQAGQQRFV
ncbi:hypothetical protein WR25_17531 [Diploscapter pachys]|uniref:Uncharacterized protein n=1 Tax=Diploscapter pachys TaxID=2018661 RepID=A0A2A2KCL3_9BILA|nr:hypothetical protein WR25_17531 [Diploscapter pachys]